MPAILEMGAEFAAASGTDMPFDPGHARAALRAHLAAPDRLTLVAEGAPGEAIGMLLAAVSVSPLAPVRLAQEIAFWVVPARRGGPAALRLLSAYEAWARDMRCDRVSLVALPSCAAGRLYRRRGFAPAETVYQKAL